MPSRLITVPFALGLDESIVPKELPLGALREAINVRQRRGRSFGQRPDYLAQDMDGFDGTVTPYDLYNLNGKLIALGNWQTLLTASPTDLFSFVEQPGGTWKGTLPTGDAGIRVPPITALRNVGQPPDIEENVVTASVAAVNGLVCLVYGTTINYVHIFDPATDATILLDSVGLGNARVVAVGDSFWIIGVNQSTSDLQGYRFDTSSDDSLQSVVTLYTGTVTTSIFDCCQVSSTAVTQFAVMVRDGSTTVIRRFNEAGVQQTSFAGPAVAASTLAIEADALVDQIVVATRVGTADVNVTTYRLSTNAVLDGPTAMFGETVTGDIHLVRLGPNQAFLDLYAEDEESTGVEILASRFQGDAHGTASARAVHGYVIGGRGAASGRGPVMPLVSADESNQLAIFDFGNGSDDIIVGAQTDLHIAKQTQQSSAVQRLGGVARDTSTGKYYWARIFEGTDGQLTCGVSEFLVSSTERRQATNIGNELFISGAVPLVYDTRQVSESGFLERPVFISSTASNGSGSLTPSSTYKYVAVFKWTNGQNRLTQSQVSQIEEVTTGASDDTITHSIYAPHTFRVDANSGSSATLSLYRTEADGSLFQLTAVAKVPLTDAIGEPITIVDTTSDTDLLDEEPVYTQGEDGPLTGVLQNDPSPPCRYCWTVGQRVFIGGLPDESEVAISKELAPGEALAFSESFAFRARVEGTVTAVAGLDGVPIAFTAEAIYRFPGLLPSDNGAEGQLGPALVIPSEGGCDNWKSIIETSLGLFYQARDGKIMLLPRGGVAPVWIGQAVRDSLASFPTITAVAYSDEDHCVFFCCQNSGGTASIILVFDLRIGQWYKDTFASDQVIRAATDYRGRLAYIDDETVRLQSSSLTPSAFIEFSSKTGSLRPFEGKGGGWGKLISIQLECEFRGNCQVRCRISYDDGQNFTNLKTFTYTTASFTVGQTIVEHWWPSIRKGAAYLLDFQVLTNGQASPGVILNSYTIEVENASPIKRQRTASAERG